MNDEYTVLLNDATGRVILVCADDYWCDDNVVKFLLNKEVIAVFNMQSIVGWYKGN